jgi:hypothetical protein
MPEINSDGLLVNSGSRPLEATDAELAEYNLLVFIDDFVERGGRLAAEPERAQDADAGGRYGWSLYRADGVTVLVLIPGVPLTLVRDDLSAEAPCLRVDDEWWWWNEAVGVALRSTRRELARQLAISG